MRDKFIRLAQRQAFYILAVPGPEQQDPGAAYYEERHRRRVLSNLQRRAKALGYVLQEASMTQEIAVKFRLIADQRERFPVRVMCDMMSVSPAGYYAWRGRPENPGKTANRALLTGIRRVDMAHHRRYGAPRIHAALRAEGHTASRGRVERLMRHHDIRAITPPRFRVCIIDSHHDLLIAPNPLGQKFAAGRPNQAWLANIIYLTYVPTGEGWLYLAAVLDLFTRKIVGWAMRDHMRAELTTAALTMAIPAAKAAYRPDPPFRSRQPIRRRRLSQGSRRSRNAARHDLFAYIERYYNRQRLPSAIGYITPEQAERQAA
jgi:putative transposase